MGERMGSVTAGAAGLGLLGQQEHRGSGRQQKLCTEGAVGSRSGLQWQEAAGVGVSKRWWQREVRGGRGMRRGRQGEGVVEGAKRA